MENIFKEKFGEVLFDDKVPCVIWKPSQYMNSEDFRKLMNIGIEFYSKKKNEIPNLVWLNDSRDMKVIGKDDQRWLEEFVNLEAQKNGLKYMGFVLPENIFGKFAVNFYINSTLSKKSLDITIKTFSKYDLAIEWLGECAESLAK